MDFRVGKTAFDRARHGLRYLAISAQSNRVRVCTLLAHSVNSDSYLEWLLSEA
jgi:hypothetical protein